MTATTLTVAAEGQGALAGDLDFSSVPQIWPAVQRFLASGDALTLSLADVGRANSAGLVMLSEAGAARVRETQSTSFACNLRRWLEIMGLAHRRGLRSNATLLYGHVETLEERVEHLCRLRELQDETGGFMCFIPLAFHPQNTELSHLPGPTGFDDLMRVVKAVSLSSAVMVVLFTFLFRFESFPRSVFIIDWFILNAFMAGSRIATLRVEGMNCSHCQESVQRALAEQSGVRRVTVSLAEARAVVEGESLDPEALAEIYLAAL